MEEVLKVIKDGMSSLGLNYEFMEWTKKVKYPYFVGEYSEDESMTEDGLCTGTVFLTGFTRGSWLELEQAKTKIENYFDRISGLIVTTGTSVVAIFYGNGMPIPTGDAELKKLQINLQFKEWKVK